MRDTPVPEDSYDFDLEDEREILAHEIVRAARALARLSDLAAIVERSGDGTGELDHMAVQLHHWARSIAINLFRPDLVDEIERSKRELAKWHQAKARFVA
jgi:hypothetical protein